MQTGNEHRTGAIALGEVYRTLGIEAAAGRLLGPSDVTPDAPFAAVLDYDFWNAEFHRDRAAIGWTLQIEERPFMIVGVTPGPSTDPALAPGHN